MAKQTGSHHRLPGSAQVIRPCVAAIDDITGARVDWADSRGLNEPERQAAQQRRGAS